MSNVSNPSGPPGPVNPQKTNEPAKPGTDAFKDLMKIDASPEKQKKHKERREEKLKKGEEKILAGPATPDRSVSSIKKPQKHAKVEKPGESEKKQTKHGKQAEETATDLAREEAAALAQKKPAAPLEYSATTEEQVEKEIEMANASAAQETKELEKLIEEEAQIVQKEEIAENFNKVVGDKQESKKSTPQQPQGAPSSTTLGPLFLSPPTAVPPAYAMMSNQTLALFEKMISMISIMKDSGMTETTIHLNTAEFANSQYYGAQIIIREYSTAPLTYNIELLGNPMAAELFRKNLGLLRSAFDDPKLRYRVHRLEASISKEPFPRVERKKESEDS